MKTITTLMVTLAMIAGAEAQQPAQQPVHRAKILKIDGQTQQTPSFQVSGPRDKPTKPRHWIEIAADIEVETTAPSGFIPELEARWFAVIKDKHSGKPVRLLGKTTFKNIRTSDKKITISAYIEPDTLERLTGSSRSSGRDIEGYALTISGEGIVTEGRHGEGLTMATAEKAAKWWETWENESLEGLIIPKSATPFGPLWTDKYPTEKTPAGQIAPAP